MKKKTVLTIVAAVLLLAVGFGVGAIAVSNFGTQSDPLVAKSYLDKVLTPQLQNQFQTQMDKQVQEMEQEIESATASAKGSFSVVSLKAGAALAGDVGCEIILRSGSASVVGGGLADVTSGDTVASGASLTSNHLCMVLTDGDGIKAGSQTTLLVRGSYKVN